MRWRKDKQHLREWHQWFAWWPTVVDDEHCVVWLETIWRRGHRYTGAGTPVWFFKHVTERPDYQLDEIRERGT